MRNIKSKIAKVINYFSDLYDLYFLEGELFYYAASLSFYSLFAIIPILLVTFDVLLLFPEFHNYFLSLKDAFLQNLVPDSLDVMQKYLNIFLQNSDNLGLVGVIYIIFTSMMFIRNFEYCASKMFDYEPHRLLNSIFRSFILLLLVPVSIVAILYFSRFKLVINNIFYAKLSNNFGFLYDSSISFITNNVYSFLVTYIIFFIMFLIASLGVKNFFKIALASLITAIVWFLFKILFVYYMEYNKTYFTLYGSISTLMMFMFWIYVSWLVVLCGMRLCRAIIAPITRPINH